MWCWANEMLCYARHIVDACLWSIPSDRLSYHPFSTWKKCSHTAMINLNLSQFYWQSDHTAIALWRPPPFLSFTLWAYISVLLYLLAGLQSQKKRGFSCPAFFATLELNFLPKTFLLNTISKYLIDQQSATFTNKYCFKDENELGM